MVMYAYSQAGTQNLALGGVKLESDHLHICFGIFGTANSIGQLTTIEWATCWTLVWFLQFFGAVGGMGQLATMEWVVRWSLGWSSWLPGGYHPNFSLLILHTWSQCAIHLYRGPPIRCRPSRRPLWLRKDAIRVSHLSMSDFVFGQG